MNYAFVDQIKSINTVEKIIRIGADKVLINSNIFEKKLTNEIINLFGKQVLVGGIDLFFKDGEYRIYQKGKTLDLNYLNYIKRVIDQGVGELKITFVNLEGTRKGLDIETANKINNSTDVPIIFEGGIKNLKDLEMSYKSGINAIGVGSMFVFSDNNIFKVKQFLDNSGLEVRLRY